MDCYYSSNNWDLKVLRSLIEIIPDKNNNLLLSGYAILAGRSLACLMPKVHTKLCNFNYVNNSDPGIRDKVSATTFSFPRICSITKSNYDKNSSHRTLRRYTPLDEVRYVRAAWSVSITKCIPINRCLQRSKLNLMAVNSLSVAE